MLSVNLFFRVFFFLSEGSKIIHFFSFSYLILTVLKPVFHFSRALHITSMFIKKIYLNTCIIINNTYSCDEVNQAYVKRNSNG